MKSTARKTSLTSLIEPQTRKLCVVFFCTLLDFETPVSFRTPYCCMVGCLHEHRLEKFTPHMLGHCSMVPEAAKNLSASVMFIISN